MAERVTDTIFALASAVGKAGVAVIRVSGPSAFSAVSTLCGELTISRGMLVREMRGRDGRLLDEALVLLFPGPGSFTGEDVAEFQVHGSSAVVAAVLGELSGMRGLRLADPGEFTRRALENGKLDLAQVEGLADLIDAETEAQRRQATRVFSGELGRHVDQWRSSLVHAAALIEASIDFADEDVPADVTDEVRGLLTSVRDGLAVMLEGSEAAERVRHGFEVAIVGSPNAGKSTLLNHLAGRDAAITSDIAGTTRDVIEVRMDIDGLPVTLLDTAGIRSSEDEVEMLGVARAVERAQAADLRVFLIGEGDTLPMKPNPHDVIVRPKADLLLDKEQAVSGKTGEGVDQLLERVKSYLKTQSSGAGLATRARHRQALEAGHFSLTETLDLVQSNCAQYEIVADELRHAIHALDSLVGRVDVEDLLDDIFSKFCIGK